LLAVGGTLLSPSWRARKCWKQFHHKNESKNGLDSHIKMTWLTQGQWHDRHKANSWVASPNQEYIMSYLYECWRVDNTTCLVKLPEETESNEAFSQDMYGTNQETRTRIRKSWLIPKFSRTRTVTLRKSDELGLWLAYCTCGTFETIKATVVCL
jgi:hypothetical protein